MSKHTPGPWERRWSSASDGSSTVETGRIQSERFGIICHLVMADDVDANAQLIAAAPEMADEHERAKNSAAILIAALSDGRANEPEFRKVLEDIRDGARAALKKAGVL